MQHSDARKGANKPLVEVQFQKGAKNDSRLKVKTHAGFGYGHRGTCPSRNHRGFCLFSVSEFHYWNSCEGLHTPHIIRAQENEIAAFNRETEIVFSYLKDSWTMKAYRKIDAVISRGGYEDWVQKVTN